jgi:azurin
MKRSSSITVWLAAFTFAFSSCGGGNENKDKDRIVTHPVEKESVAPVAEVSNTISLEAYDEMKYNKTELKALAGKPITLTLTHVGTMDKNAMGHNFVLLKQGSDVNDFVQKALTAKDNDYIPKSESSKIIAHTKLLAGGESDTIVFTVPEKGSYDYICSFPGHAALMKGKLIVQ